MIYNSKFLELLEALPFEKIVCENEGKTLSAGKLRQDSIALALWLSNKGVKRGDHVLMAAEGGIQFLILFYALIHIRAKIALVDPHMGRQLYWAKVQQFKPKYAFIDSRILLLQEHPILRYFYLKRENPFYIPYSKSYQIFSTGFKLPLFQKHKRLPKNLSLEADQEIINDNTNDELVLVYTSGTLAEPKAVVHTMDSLYQNMIAISTLLDKNPNNAIITHLPQFAIIGMMNGYRVQFWKESYAPAKKLELIEKNQITSLFGPPAEYLELINYCQIQRIKFPECLEHILIGSAPVLRPFLQLLRNYTDAKITCLYGMTENLVVASIDGDEKIRYEGNGDLLGKPYAAINMHIEDDHELKVNSPLMYERYFHLENRPEYHETGDLVQLDSEGRLVMMGRKKNMIIRKSKNIYPGLYEDTICSIPGIQDAVMRGIYDHELHDEKVVLVVESENGISEESIMKQLKSGPHQIDSDVLPDTILKMKIPRAGRQMKVNQRKLDELIKAQIS